MASCIWQHCAIIVMCRLSTALFNGVPQVHNRRNPALHSLTVSTLPSANCKWVEVVGSEKFQWLCCFESCRGVIYRRCKVCLIVCNEFSHTLQHFAVCWHSGTLLIKVYVDDTSHLTDRMTTWEKFCELQRGNGNFCKSFCLLIVNKRSKENKNITL